MMQWWKGNIRWRNSSWMGWSGDVTAKSFFQRTMFVYEVNGYGDKNGVSCDGFYTFN